MSDIISFGLLQDTFGYKDTQKTIAALLIDWISQKAESIIGREIMSELRTVYLEGLGTNKIILPVIPVTSITSITLDADHLFTGDALATTDYYIDLKTGIITLYEKTTSKNVNTVKVVYTAGYAESTVPADLKLACLESVQWNMSRIIDKQFGIRNETTPDGINRAYEMVLPMGAQRVFESYKDVRI